MNVPIRIPGAGLQFGPAPKASIQLPASPQQASAVAPTSSVVFDDEEVVESDESLPPFPKFTGLLTDLCEALSPDIPYAYLISSAFAFAGIMRSGLDTLADEPHFQPRLYVALIGAPSSGKSAAMTEVGKIMRSASNNYKSYSAIDSGPALVDAFNDENKSFITKIDAGTKLGMADIARIILCPDEIKNIFDKSKNDSGGKHSLLGELLKLYEGNVTGSRVRGMKIKVHLENAHLGLLGGATPAGYEAMWTGTAGASDGLQSRIIPIGLDAGRMPARQRQPNGDKLAAVITQLVEYAKAPNRAFEVSDAAWAMFTEWWEKKDQVDRNVPRLDGIAKRLMIILAGTNPQQVVDESLVSQAISFADYVQACRAKFNPADATNHVQSMENLIVHAYEKYSDMTRNQCRRRTNADRRPGGMGPFLQAFRNLRDGERLKPVGKNHKGEVFRLFK